MQAYEKNCSMFDLAELRNGEISINIDDKSAKNFYGNTKKGSENNPYMNLLTFHYTKPSIIFQSYKSVKHVVSTSLFAVDN